MDMWCHLKVLSPKHIHNMNIKGDKLSIKDIGGKTKVIRDVLRKDEDMWKERLCK